MPSWSEKAVIYKHKAQRHARMMLATAYNVPKVAKYKLRFPESIVTWTMVSNAINIDLYLATLGTL
jgi:hypothetical protein